MGEKPWQYTNDFDQTHMKDLNFQPLRFFHLSCLILTGRLRLPLGWRKRSEYMIIVVFSMSMAPILSKVKVVAACQCCRRKTIQGQSDMFTYVSFSNLKNKKSVALVFLERGRWLHGQHVEDQFAGRNT